MVTGAGHRLWFQKTGGLWMPHTPAAGWGWPYPAVVSHRAGETRGAGCHPSPPDRFAVMSW
ncbi:hypothetical protein BCD48_40165 [Pseudofrankia sp. BMG5.36]|nr:hypothetical protein BCD48_40165 [Pseudofrankia sp. BMG5.36]